MDAIVGRSKKGEYWFKSDQSLVNLTHAIEFYTKPSFWFWNKTYYLIAKYKKSLEPSYGNSYATYKVWSAAIGTYSTKNLASLALSEVMKVLEIKEL